MGTAQASDYLENKLIDHLFRTATFAKPAGLFLALYTAAPSDSGGGTEVTGGSYARASLSPLDTNWAGTHGTTVGASSGNTGITSNKVAIIFPAPTASWGTVTHYALFDAATGGNFLIWDALTTPRTVLAGDGAPSFAVDQFTITIS